MKKYVFISYKSEDFEAANRIRKNINSYGIDTWMAPESISGGASYASEIPQAIQNCTVFLLIMTANTQNSKWVPREVDQAINENKKILPYFIEKCKLESEFKFYLTNVQSYYEFETHYDAFELLMGQIALAMGEEIEYIGENRDEALIRLREQEQQAAQSSDESEKPKSSPKKQKSKPADKPKKKNAAKKLAVVLAAILAVVVLIIAASALNSVTIADKKFKKNDYSVILNGVTLSDEDILNFEKFKDLHGVHLTDCTIQSDDISGILEKVTMTFSAVNCGITDSMLASADLSTSEISDITLTNNAGVTSLDVFAPVIQRVTSLEVSGTGISDLSALDGSLRLTSLGADGLGLESISFLSKCSALEKLSVNSNRLTSVSALSDCGELTSLKVNDNLLTNLAGLEKSLKLKELEACGNKIIDISGLKNATVLKSVYLNGNSLTDLSPLDNSKNTISVLFLADCGITQMVFNKLPELPELSTLGIDNNYIEDISVLSASPKLESITAHGNQITNADALLDKTEIKVADLSDNKISSFYTENPVGFGSMKNRVTLDIRGNGITRFAVPCRDFAYLLTSGNAIENTDFFKELTYFDFIELDYRENIAFDALAAIGGKVIIAGCPLDKQLALSNLIGENRTVFNDSYNPPADYIPESLRGGYAGQ